MEITKNLVARVKNDQTFTFVVKDANDTEVAQVPITIKADAQTATVTDAKALASLTNLARGTYTVEEVERNGYMLNGAVSDDVTDCYNSFDNTKVTFVLGNSTDNQDVINNYTYDESKGGTLGAATFTNEPVYSNWQIIKVSSSNHGYRIPGAVFELQSTTGVKYYGKSGDAGIVEWYQTYQNDKVSDELARLQEGTYTLKEIKAPTGYVLTNDTYTLNIARNGALKSIKLGDTEVVPELQNSGEYHILIENAVIYSLPNSGGSGIYWYSICGMLLMMAAAWILYKNKCREVLVK